MGLGRPAVEGQAGRDLGAGRLGGYDIVSTGGEALHPGGAVHAKEVVVVGKDSNTVMLLISGPVGAVLPVTSVRARVKVPYVDKASTAGIGGIARDGAVQHGEGAAGGVRYAAAAEVAASEIARDGAVQHGEGAAVVRHTTADASGGIARDGAVEHGEGAAGGVRHAAAGAGGGIARDGAVRHGEGAAEVRHPAAVAAL